MSLLDPQDGESKVVLRNLSRAELLFVLSVEIQLIGSLIRSWFDPTVDILYLVIGASLLVLFIKARNRNTVEAYRSFGTIGFALLLLDVVISLVRLR